MMVSSLDDMSKSQRFSLVPFADAAQVLASSTSAENAQEELLDLEYSAGTTNLSDALTKCQSSFESPDRKNFIIVITDGAPNDLISADLAATAAKDAGTTIFPVYVEPFSSSYAFDFMRQISSDGSVFDVTQFEDLDTLQQKLLNRISCSDASIFSDQV